MSTESMEKNGESKDAGVEVSPWRTLFRLARPFRTRILIIILLAALSTAATLIEPLIYRVAVNDVSGLFVRKAQEQNEQHEEDTSPVSGVTNDFNLSRGQLEAQIGGNYALGDNFAFTFGVLGGRFRASPRGGVNVVFTYDFK